MTDTAAVTTPEPTQQRRAMPESLAAFLYLARVFIRYGRRFTETAAERAAQPQFVTVAAVFGTHNLSTILARIQRGILRAMVLERYLLARAERGREIEFVLRRDRSAAKRPDAAEPAPPAPPRQPAARRPRPDPDDLSIPTMEQLDAEVRRRPIGRTITYICMDLGVIPAFCNSDVWGLIYKAFQWYGGSIHVFYDERLRREETFQKERDKRPETWDRDWRDLYPQTVCQLLGSRIGDPPLDAPVPS